MTAKAGNLGEKNLSMGLCAAQQQLFTVQLAIVQKIYRNLIKKVSSTLWYLMISYIALDTAQ